MRISKERFKRIILEEQQRLQEELADLSAINPMNVEEKKLAQILLIFLGKAREKFEEYQGNLPEGEEPTDGCQTLFNDVGQLWQFADHVLTGGETKDALPNLFETKTFPPSLSSEFDVSVQRLVNSITRKDETDVAHKFMELYKQISNRSETGEADFYQELGRALKEIGDDVEAHGHQSEEPTSKIGRWTFGRSPSVERGDVFRSPGMPDIRIDERENSNLAKKRIREKQKK